MILSAKQYALRFPQNGKTVCAETIKNRCRNNQLPTNHIAQKVNSVWVIEIREMPEDWKNFEVKLIPKK